MVNICNQLAHDFYADKALVTAMCQYFEWNNFYLFIHMSMVYMFMKQIIYNQELHSTPFFIQQIKTN